MKENTEKGTSDETEKKSELRSGALRSSLAVELHTRYAILLWEGQHAEKKMAEKFLIAALWECLTFCIW